MQQLELQLSSRRRTLARQWVVVEGFHQMTSRGDFLVQMHGKQQALALSNIIPDGFVGQYNGRAAGPYRYKIFITVESVR